jgi:hypothetical protein
MSRRGKGKRRLSACQTGGLRRGKGGARRLKWLRLPALVAICASLAALVAFFALGVGSRGQSGPPKAAIVDQLSLTSPNPAFAKEASTLLADAGYDVDYTPGEAVTVDFYRQLGRGHYDVIVLRIHVGRELDPATKTLSDDAVLFTAEPYSDIKYVSDQEAQLLGIVSYQPGAERYFGVFPEFIASAMRGNFNGATVILMGCDGLRSNKMAEAFVRKGAEAFISWDDLVSADHTDAATERLLQHLVVDKLGAQESVTRTMTEIGPDPSYGSKLVLYPPAASASAAP